MIGVTDWIDWSGGEMPVEEGTLVDVEHRNGGVWKRVKAGFGSATTWDHYCFDGDIIRYRVHMMRPDAEDGAGPVDTGGPIHATVNPYARRINGAVVDVYDILHAYGVTNPAIQHLVKKALMPGERGHKSREKDLREIYSSAKRALEIEGCGDD